MDSAVIANDSTTLTYLVRPPKTQSAKTPLLILLHGVGSNEKDLFGLAPQLPDNYLVVSARGPVQLGNDRFGWYEVDFSTGAPLINQKQEQESRKAIINFIGQLKEKWQFDEEQVYLLGFSQGAIMSYSVALTQPGLIKGIAVMSGRLLEEVKPVIKMNEKLANLQVFISHGVNDNVLGVQYAREAAALLKFLQINVSYNEYPAGHTITPGMLADVKNWLK